MSDTVIHPRTATTARDGAERIAELWPQLPEDVRQELVEIAEAGAAGDDAVDFPLTAKEMASVEAARRDFAEGRTMTLEEVEASIRLRLSKLP